MYTYIQLVSAAKIANPPISKDEEIVTATPDSSSIVSTGSDVPDGNIVSGKGKSLERGSKRTGGKHQQMEKNRTIDNAEIVEVHQSPTNSSGGASSAGSSTWSVKMSPIKKRFSFKRSSSMAPSSKVSTDTEGNVTNDNKENKIEEVLDKYWKVLEEIRMYWSRVVCLWSAFLTHTVLTVLLI